MVREIYFSALYPLKASWPEEIDSLQGHNVKTVIKNNKLINNNMKNEIK